MCCLLFLLVNYASADFNCTPIDDKTGVCYFIMDPVDEREIVALRISDLKLNLTTGILAIWDVVELNITSSRPIKVFWHGGTEWESIHWSVWNRKLCWSPFNLNSWFFYDKHLCNVKLSTLSKWYPVEGESRIDIVSNSWKRWTIEISYAKSRDQSMLISLAIGTALYLFAPFLGHSRAIHISMGTLLGSGGAILFLLIFLFRMMPRGKRGGFGVFLAAGGAFGAYLRDWIYSFLFKENLPYVLAFMAVGALFGFMVSYRFELEEKSRSLLTILMRMLACACIAASFTSFLVAGMYWLLLTVVVTFMSSVCCESDVNSVAVTLAPVSDLAGPVGEHYDEHMCDGKDEGAGDFHGTPVLWSNNKQIQSSHVEKSEGFENVYGPAYISPEEHEIETRLATEEGLSELRKKLERGEYTHVLTHRALKAVSEFIAQ
eukprot:gb/GEZN01006761.1/.p1 GENE.gb/GEZN01006761.1/~~gb/GEZN01006761.1/.p1  ORF type:complete len:432 (+),score=33.28 gb/GEZN01006761.1/:207-1502(+)